MTCAAFAGGEMRWWVKRLAPDSRRCPGGNPTDRGAPPREFIQTGFPDQTLLGASLYQPVDVRLRERLTKSGESGKCVNDVADGAELDDEDVHDFRNRSRSRAMRSRVEWSLGWPTILVRPPIRFISSCSGTPRQL